MKHTPPSRRGILTATAIAFWKSKALDHAASLSYATALSLVPLLTLVFAVIKHFVAHPKIEAIILTQLTGHSQDAGTYIMKAVKGANTFPLWTIGGISLSLSLLTLFISIESTMREIFGTRSARKFMPHPLKYLLLVILAPMLLVTAVTATTIIESRTIFEFLRNASLISDGIRTLIRFAPYFGISFFLIVFYHIVPNRPIKLAHAAAGGIFSGIAWQIAHWGYFSMQMGVTTFNIIYGSLSAIPILLVWIYTSWAIIIFGAYLVQQLSLRNKRPH